MATVPPLPTNISTPLGIATYMNEATSGYFWGAMLFAIFAIILIGLNYRMDSKDAFATSAFICMIIAILMRTTELVQDGIMNLFAILAIIGVGLIWMRGRTTY